MGRGVGEDEDDDDDVAALERRMVAAGLPDNVWAHVRREIRCIVAAHTVLYFIVALLYSTQTLYLHA